MNENPARDTPISPHFSINPTVSGLFRGASDMGGKGSDFAVVSIHPNFVDFNKDLLILIFTSFYFVVKTLSFSKN